MGQSDYAQTHETSHVPSLAGIHGLELKANITLCHEDTAKSLSIGHGQVGKEKAITGLPLSCGRSYNFNRKHMLSDSAIRAYCARI